MKATGTHQLAITTTVDEVTGEVKPLFSFPVQVVKATEDGDVKLDNAAPSGAEGKVQYLDPATGENYEYGDRLRGLRVGDEFKAIDPEALKAIDAQTKIDTMVALGSVDLDEARAKYADRITGRYFLQVPAKGGSAVAYRLTYEGLRKGKGKGAKAKAIVAKRTARSRQKLVLIYADERCECLVMLELAFAAQVRQPDEQIKAPLTATVEAKQVEQVRTVLAGLPDGGQALEAEVDEAVALKRELCEKAIAGETIATPTPVAATSASEDVSSLLEASIAALK